MGDAVVGKTEIFRRFLQYHRVTTHEQIAENESTVLHINVYVDERTGNEYMLTDLSGEESRVDGSIR